MQSNMRPTDRYLSARYGAGASCTSLLLHIIIIDDGPQAAEALTADARTSLARLLALSDASLFVDHRPGDGTTVMLTLSDAA